MPSTLESKTQSPQEGKLERKPLFFWLVLSGLLAWYGRLMEEDGAIIAGRQHSP